MNHSKLLNKLNFYGVRGKALDWIASFLRDRKQCTEITKLDGSGHAILKKTYRSTFKTNDVGVPQGSVLGPLLFLLYVNDLPDSTCHGCIQFADDTTLLIKSNNINSFEYDTNNAFKDIIKWMNVNNLSNNINKTKIMQFSSYNSNSKTILLSYNNEVVNEVDTVNFLGIMIDKNLNWKAHIDSVCNRLNRFVFALRRLRQTISTEAALIAYHGYVSSVLRYGLILWGNSVDVEKAFKVQKKSIRAVCNAKFDDSCKPLFRKMNILPLPCLYIRDICLFVKDHPEYWKTQGEVSHRPTRSHYTNLLHQPPAFKKIYEKNVFHMCPSIYNHLPDDIKCLTGNIFKSKLTAWLLQNCFYSIKEFRTYKIELMYK